MKRWGATLTVALAAASCQGDSRAPHAAPPHAGFTEREIAALAPSQVEDLLAGRGAGYALAAELNQYPGPLHVLELSGSLELTDEQLDETREIRRAMLARARELGRRVVELERRLDEAFASRAITTGSLTALTEKIGAVEAELRATHLRAHIQLRQVLTPSQIERYDHLRGYGRAPGGQPPHGDGQGEPEHG